MDRLKQRAEDEKLLLKALAHDLTVHEREAFADMSERLRLGERIVLSDAQRSWVRKALDRYEPQYENLVSSGRVPFKSSSRKFEFETMPKPLRPPMRPRG